MEEKEGILRILCQNLRQAMKKANIDWGKLKEIRLRIGQPVLLLYEKEMWFLETDGSLSKVKRNALVMTRDEMKESLEYISGYSMYIHGEAVKRGYLTVPGGHRVGMTGRSVLENGKIKALMDIGMLNIRVAHEKVGCGRNVFAKIWGDGNIYNTLIISPPGGGKTTLLRDLIRILASEQVGMTVGVVDERSELAACYEGVPQHNIGISADVLDGCPKAEGMEMLLRSMAPDIIAVDELGQQNDLEALERILNCGCKVIATAHGESIEEIQEKLAWDKVVKERWFSRFVLMDSRYQVGNIKAIYDETGHLLTE